MSKEQTRHIGYVAFFVFLLFCVPRLNVRFGPIPVYAIDLVAAFLLYVTFQSKKAAAARVPFARIIIVVGFFVVFSELTALIYGASLPATIYVSARYVLAFSIAFSIPVLIQSKTDVETILKALALALLITSLIMLSSSLPGVRSIAVFLFSISYLEPANAAQKYADVSATEGVRGRTLIGVSILSGAFISIGWPLIAYLRTRRFKLSGFWSLVSMSAVTVSPLAIALTYSRQAALGAIMVMVATLILPYKDLRLKLLKPFLICSLVVLFVGVGSSIFFFDRYVTRTVAIVENPLEDEREYHRLLSFVKPFEHLAEHPQFFFLGAGSNNLRSQVFRVTGFEENHSLMGAGYFAHGMLSTLLLFFVVFGGYYYVNWHRKKSRSLAFAARGWPRSIYLAYLPILPMAAFAPALGTNVRAMYIYMFVIGLMATLRNANLMADLEDISEPSAQGSKPSRKRKYRTKSHIRNKTLAGPAE